MLVFSCARHGKVAVSQSDVSRSFDPGANPWLDSAACLNVAQALELQCSLQHHALPSNRSELFLCTTSEASRTAMQSATRPFCHLPRLLCEVTA